MNESKISVRYAKALFNLAQEKKQLEAVKNDMSFVFETCNLIPDFIAVLNSPIIRTSEKQRFFKEVFDGKVNEISYSFLSLVLTNKRETYLKDITRNFLALYRNYTGYKSAILSSATSIDIATIEEFRNVIRQNFKTEVDLTCEVKPELIGGFVLRVEDQQIDASVSSKLKRLKQELVKSK